MKHSVSETQIQISLADFLEKALRKDVEWTAFPAGGGGRIRGARLKRMGLKPGWPDLLFLRWGSAFNDTGTTCVYGLELKADKGKVSDTQHYRHARLQACGVEIGVAHGFDEAVAVVKGWGLLR